MPLAVSAEVALKVSTSKAPQLVAVEEASSAFPEEEEEAQASSAEVAAEAMVEVDLLAQTARARREALTVLLVEATRRG